MGGTRPLLLGAALTAADRLLPVARAAAAAAGARRRGADRARARGRAPARRRRRPRRAVVRLPGVRRGARAEGPGALRLGPRRLRADHVGPHRRRGRAREGARGPPTGRSARSTSSTATAGRTGGFDRASDDPTLDLPADWRDAGRASRTGIQVSVQRMRGTDVVGAGTTVDGRGREPPDRARRRARAVAVGRRAAHRRLLRARASTCPRPTTDQLAARASRRPSTEHAEDLEVRVRLRELTPAEVDALPDGRAAQLDRRAARRDSATIEFPPFGRDGARADRPTTAPTAQEGDGDDGAAALRPLAHLRARAAAEGAAPRRRTSTRSPSTTTCASGFTYTEKPPAPAPGRRAARVVPVRHQGRLLPALLGGDGAAAADGRRPRARGDRLLAGRLLQAQAGLDRARHRRALVGGGVVRRLRLDHAGPDAGRHAGALADRLDRGADGAPSRPPTTRRATRTPAAPRPADRRAAGSREELFNQLRGGGGTATEDERRARRLRRAAVAADPARRCCCSAGAAVAGRAAPPRRPDDPLERAILELETALRRSGPPDAGGHDAAPARAPARPLRRGRRLPARGQRRALRAAARRRRRASSAARCAASSRPARGCAGRVRTFWALPPRALGPAPTARAGRRRRTGR